MNYSQIISKAFSYIKKYRFLWWLGILAALTEGGAANFYSLGNFFSQPGSSSPDKIQHTTASSVAQSFGRLPRVLGASDSGAGFSRFVSNYSLLILILLILLLALLAIIWYLSYSSKAGLVLSIHKLESDETDIGFGAAFKGGQKYCWKLISLNLLVAVIIILLIAVFATPIGLLMLLGHSAGLIIGILLIFIGLVFLLLFGTYLAMILRLSERLIVLQDFNIMRAAKESNIMLRKRFADIFVSYLISMGFSFAYSFALSVVLLVVGGVLFGVGYLLYLLTPMAALVYGILAGLGFCALLVVLRGIFVAFVSSFWTLAYLEIKQKIASQHE